MDKADQKSGNKMQKNSSSSAPRLVGPEGKSLLQRLDSKIKLLAILIIVVCIVVAVTHWPALSAQAMSFDDDKYLTENLLVQNPSWESTKRFATEVLEPSTVRGYYQPLTMISLMVDYGLGGRVDDLRQFRRTSLALHVTNTALIIVLLYLLFSRVWIAVVVGLLFGVHPMTVETIPWVGERKTLLAAFFSLWALILYLRFVRKSDWRLYTGCMAMYVLALVSKPTSTPLPAMMLLMDFWPLRRLSKRAVLEKVPLFVIGAISAGITYISQSRTASTAVPGDYKPIYALWILCHNIIFYLYKIIWPIKLTPYYPFPRPLGLSDPMVATGVIGTCILIPLLIISLRWTRALLTGWLFFFVAIFPTMGIVGFTMVIASDKYAYLPSVGFLMVLAAFLAWFCGAAMAANLAGRRAVVVIIVLVLAAAEAVGTRRYLPYWRDSVTLFKHMSSFAPDAPLVYNNLGLALEAEGRIEEAVYHYRQALYYKPSHAEARNNLGIILAAQGRLDEAIEYFRRALRDRPDFAEVHRNLGQALHSQGKLDEAVKYYRQALVLEPDDGPTHYNLGVARIMTNRTDEGFAHFREALRLKPDWPMLLNSMAWVLATHTDANLRNAGEAVELAERAAGLTKYKDASVLDTLAAAYASAGQFTKAISAAERALKLASAMGTNELANQIRNRLQLYKQAKPYREPVSGSETIGR